MHKDFTFIKVFVVAGEASAAPPLGPILAQFGVNMSQFCKEFNELTEPLIELFLIDSLYEINDFNTNFVVTVEIFIYNDRTYKFFIKKPPISFLLKLLANVQKGIPGQVGGYLTINDIVFIAKFKYPFLELKFSCFLLLGTARSIGIKFIK